MLTSKGRTSEKDLALAAARGVAEGEAASKGLAKDAQEEIGSATIETLLRKRQAGVPVASIGALARTIARGHIRNLKKKKKDLLGTDPDFLDTLAASVSVPEPDAIRRRGAGKRKLTGIAEARAAIRAFAQAQFEDSTGGLWSEVIESTFKGWIGEDWDYSGWNADAKVAARLRKVLTEAVAHWRKHSRTEPQSGFVEWVGDHVDPLLGIHGGALECYAEKRWWSRDVRLIRYVDNWGFLGLGRDRCPTVDELTSISILLEHSVEPKAGETVLGYFRKHRKRLTKLRKRKKKGSAAFYWDMLERNGVKPIDWPPLDRKEP